MPPARPPVSILIPFYNQQHHLAACLESLLAQQDFTEAFEILLIDNRSTDDSVTIAQRFTEQDPRITLLSEDTPGAYAARNTGIRHARGEILAFTDADCTVHPRWLAEIREGMEDDSVGGLVGHCRYPEEASWVLRLLGAYENAKTEYCLHHLPPAHSFAYANNLAVRASVFEEIGLFEEWRRAGDSELVHRMVRERPHWRVVFRRSMQMTHREFLRARDRLRRLSLYTDTNSRIETFKELSVAQRLAVVGHLVRNLRAML
jgi:glycosyltransferase involved in cell wall biosynthesis